ncbi:MAG: L,D-transpeptidase [Bacteroidota bacterium]|nr:L,D-transpeptidase [Bacteroidota bacterium]
MKTVYTFTLILILSACNNQNKKEKRQRISPKNNTYQLTETNTWILNNGNDSQKMRIALAVNRTDSQHLIKMDSIIMPDDLSGDLEFYMHFPISVTYLKNIRKIIYFSYGTQTFATYEMGELTYSGPTNMGKKTSQTPTGLFFTNWKAEETISTFNDEWKLFWNFNIENKAGIGWHQYNLPGYPASSSCLRLQERDAKYLYQWANQWVLADQTNVLIKGTPVIVFGTYQFDKKKPWLALINQPKLLNMSDKQIKNETIHFYNHIMYEQFLRDEYQDSIKKSIEE